MKNKISTDKNSHITMLQWNLLTTDQFPFTKDNPGSSSHSLLDQIFIVKIVLKLKSNQKKNINKFHAVNNIKWYKNWHEVNDYLKYTSKYWKLNKLKF